MDNLNRLQKVNDRFAFEELNKTANWIVSLLTAAIKIKKESDSQEILVNMIYHLKQFQQDVRSHHSYKNSNLPGVYGNFVAEITEVIVESGLEKQYMEIYYNQGETQKEQTIAKLEPEMAREALIGRFKGFRDFISAMKLPEIAQVDHLVIAVELLVHEEDLVKSVKINTLINALYDMLHKFLMVDDFKFRNRLNTIKGLLDWIVTQHADYLNRKRKTDVTSVVTQNLVEMDGQMKVFEGVIKSTRNLLEHKDVFPEGWAENQVTVLEKGAKDFLIKYLVKVHDSIFSQPRPDLSVYQSRYENAKAFLKLLNNE